MQKHQAEHIADQLLVREPRPPKIDLQAHLRWRAILMLIGCAGGAAIAYAKGIPIAEGCIWGGFAGVAVSIVIKLARSLRPRP